MHSIYCVDSIMQILLYGSYSEIVDSNLQILLYGYAFY